MGDRFGWHGHSWLCPEYAGGIADTNRRVRHPRAGTDCLIWKSRRAGERALRYRLVSRTSRTFFTRVLAVKGFWRKKVERSGTP